MLDIVALRRADGRHALGRTTELLFFAHFAPFTAASKKAMPLDKGKKTIFIAHTRKLEPEISMLGREVRRTLRPLAPQDVIFDLVLLVNCL